jgi:adenosylcobinamide-GDP ribazoletransferase
MLAFLSLLSRIRIGRKEVDVLAVAKRQYLFPAAGFIIGAIIAVVALLLFEFADAELDIFLISLGIVLFLYFVTGLIHIEGLADFGDGLMASGSQERKRQAMKDVSLGAGGTFFMVAAFLATFLLVTHLDGWIRSPDYVFWTDSIPLVFGLIIAEISAKISMITVMTIGPSSHQGMGSVFVSAAGKGKLAAGIAIALLIAFILSGPYSMVVLIGPVSGAIVAFEARRHFGGVGGDSFGAANELGRILTLLAWVILI